MTSFSRIAMVAVSVMGLTACSDTGVGKKCQNPSGEEVTGTAVAFPALECNERLCYLKSETPKRGICTAACETDADCSTGITGNPDSPDFQCDDKFVCAVATITGDFCCKKICLCRKDLIDGHNWDPINQKAMTPNACGSGSTCKNVK